MTRQELRDCKGWQDIVAGAQTLKDAMGSVFDAVEERDGAFFATCCGKPCIYQSGLVGTDRAYCGVCGSEVLLLLSPHVSPLLLDFGRACTHMPTDELADALDGRFWLAVADGPKAGIPVP